GAGGACGPGDARGTGRAGGSAVSGASYAAIGEADETDVARGVAVTGAALGAHAARSRLVGSAAPGCGTEDEQDEQERSQVRARPHSPTLTEIVRRRCGVERTSSWAPSRRTSGSPSGRSTGRRLLDCAPAFVTAGAGRARQLHHRRR